MKYSIKKKYVTGVAIPISTLRTETSCGIGEFSDLKKFGEWCHIVGLDLIQLLPVNDTGYQSSPYSALSAFALHPIYIRISELDETTGKECKEIHDKWNDKKSIDFNGILKDKLDLLRKIYKENMPSISKSKKITEWEKQNNWVKSYALFSHIKAENENKNWEEWTEHRDIDDQKIAELYAQYKDDMRFYSWIQYNLEKQLSDASRYLEKMGINLKGDLPILMNTDSCDVWQSREIFDLDHRAGAPPDMFSADGQNWGFPTYNWKAMENDDYNWWKSRLKQAAKFYHAYRIDHVLGFFRIWSIPSKYSSGSMGYYRPNEFLTLKDLQELGFSDERIKWLTEPHIPGHELRYVLDLESNEVIKCLLKQIENEDLYLFKDNIKSVDQIRDCKSISDEAIEKMIKFFQNVSILKIEDDSYIPSWYYHDTRAFHTLSDHEKHMLGEMLKSKGKKSMELWKNQGLKLLKFMKESEDMLVCAEDLGAVPHCVPEVLEELGILGLHVTRWAKKYGEPGEPYIKPSEYKYLSVSTPAVHDSSTVRQWLGEVASVDDLSYALNIDDPLKKEPTPSEVKKLYKALLETSSKIAMFQFQDLLAIDKDLARVDLHSERINIPGTVGENNWSYRVDFKIEELINNSKYNTELKNLLATRKDI